MNNQRLRRSIETLAREKRDIYQFILDDLIKEKGTRIFLNEVFDAYKLWRKRLKLVPSVLSIDGFGRMFPKHFQRKKIHREGQVCSALLDANLRTRH